MDIHDFAKRDSLIAELKKEQRYSTQELFDKVTNGKCLLVYRYMNFEAGHDIHVSKTDILYNILKDDPYKIFKIVFVPGNVYNGLNNILKNQQGEEKAALLIKEAKLVVLTDDELIFREVRGKWIENNLSIMKLTAEWRQLNEFSRTL